MTTQPAATAATPAASRQACEPLRPGNTTSNVALAMLSRGPDCSALAEASSRFPDLERHRVLTTLEQGSWWAPLWVWVR